MSNKTKEMLGKFGAFIICSAVFCVLFKEIVRP